MVSLVRRAAPLTDDPHRLQALCRRLFTKRRKQIGAILGRDAPLPPTVAGDLRPENLSIEQAVALSLAVPPETPQAG